MGEAPVEAFFERFAGAWKDESLLRLTLGGPRNRGADLHQILVRPVALRAGPRLSVVWRHATRDVTKNLPFEEGAALLGEMLGREFGTAALHTREASWALEFRHGRGPVLRRLPAAIAAPAAVPGGGFPSHDAAKSRPIPEDRPWLRALGVTGPSGRVLAGAESKYRQICRYVELLEPMLAVAPLPAAGPLTLVDMGCGKGYLTFAAFERLRALFPGREILVIGVEERAELAAASEAAARAAGFAGLSFRAGRISGAVAPQADVVVALHACDTATDDAIAWAVQREAALVVTSPCCHKEVRTQIAGGPPWRMALTQGILAERQAEWVTDAMRAALLEWSGYEARVMEFISPEHTAKNLLLAGVRRGAGARSEGRSEAAESARGLAALFHVSHQALAARLGFPLAAGA